MRQERRGEVCGKEVIPLSLVFVPPQCGLIPKRMCEPLAVGKVKMYKRTADSEEDGEMC